MDEFIFNNTAGSYLPSLGKTTSMKVTYQFKVVLERKHYQKSWIVHIRVCSEDFIFTEKKLHGMALFQDIPDTLEHNLLL